MSAEIHAVANIPRATYRLQFSENFRLPDALALVPYLHELGVSHIYSSPLFKACPHSTHGYDVADFSELNPELGTEADLEKLVTALRAHDMGLILDIVPNHMGIAARENSWWWDVLKNGRASPFANHFDINWETSDPKLRGKILLPVLGKKNDEVFKSGELKIKNENDEFILCCGENKFPLAPNSSPKKLSLEKINSDSAALDELLQRQNYRLAFSGEGNSALNYRRFFAVNSLAGVRVETEKVFDDVHSLVKKWLGKNWLDGLRVDHPDGLRDPENYLRRLRQLAPDKWIVVEKILMPGENLPPSWPVEGTTGYDFLNRVNSLFIDRAGEKPLTDFYAGFTGEPADFTALASEKKFLVLNDLFIAEITRLCELLRQIAAQKKRGFSSEDLSRALKKLAANFPVYRTYLAPENKADIPSIEKILGAAQAQRPDLPPALFDFLSDIFFARDSGDLENEFIARFQQLTGPVMAKGVEDTAFYCFNRFASLNEVGGSPEIFGGDIESFHEFCQRQKNHWPHSLLTTSTHDTKRAEDVRARLNVLSEIPVEWTQTVARWSALNSPHRRRDWPDRNAEYFFYQTLVGAWPISTQRALACMEKSVREAAQQTTWTQNNHDYESALTNFITESLRDSKFTGDLQRFVDRISDVGFVNSLAQTLVKLSAPGVPDIYQGCELLDFSLVDPDNRRPVDFELRQRLLAESKNISSEKIWERRSEGLPKIWLIQKVLAFRKNNKVFFESDYEPLFARGEKSNRIVAFMRGGGAITVIPRLVFGLINWGDTFLELPRGGWKNEFTGENFSGALRITDLLEKFPVALLARKEQI